MVIHPPNPIQELALRHVAFGVVAKGAAGRGIAGCVSDRVVDAINPSGWQRPAVPARAAAELLDLMLGQFKGEASALGVRRVYAP